MEEKSTKKELLASLRAIDEQIIYYRSKIKHNELLKDLVLKALEKEEKNE